MPPLIHITGSTFRDPQDREITLHGINISGDCKLPYKPDIPSHVRERFFDGDDVSFVGRPFPLAEAHEHFARLRRWGYNTIRYIYTWEALEHAGPGKYDEEYCDFTIKVLRVAKSYGFRVFMDPHQDVWSRFTGGSGAPLWTVYACGLDPKKFLTTEAALVQNTWEPSPAEFPKMIWATNYTRLAVQTIFTLFFAGRDFAPKCIIDGVNIQDYLQTHFVNACKHLCQKVHDAGDLEGDCVIGWESINEPNRGYVGWPDLTKLPDDQKLRKGTTPTGWQAMLTGSGRAVEVETWDFGGLGPYKSGTQLIDPKRTTAWLSAQSGMDERYGWKRDPDWRLGECIWAQHGVWDPKTDELLEPLHFSKHPSTGEHLDHEYFTNHYFMHYYRQFRDAVRSIWPESMMFIQPSPFDIPPRIRDTADNDDNMVFASHFYDGITLITKKWNRWWNVDVFGVLRGKYLTPAFAVKVGETAIRNCFKDQLSAIRDEGVDYMGVHPCMYTEIGIPYDMDQQYAYKTGDYSSQSAAIDANMFAVEGSRAAGFTWWDYTAANSHQWGDQWNGEDLSIYSADDKQLPTTVSFSEANASKASLATSSASTTVAGSSVPGPGNEEEPPVTPSTLNKTLTVDRMSSTSSGPSDTKLGYRGAEAFIRPHPNAVHGNITTHAFDLRSATYTLAVTAKSSTPSEYPTEIFLPEFHFPRQHTEVNVTGGKWTISFEDASPDGDGTGKMQVLKWWHGEGEQKLEVTGVKRDLNKKGLAEVVEEDEGYLGQYLRMGKNCNVM
ncbi:glycoside hydrolase family 5 protein [Polychaeton citri CBS 116435]|uniref:Glycoside hydrolase family 5 protein n=1 Tax=Polychaeton citri CBS 116435 TaxID=1314669 RepID=A0A9P4PZ63_9PEZI|nr:glycoside hydrolase family 5 protein [Polychaeton citri CBS 116435]